LGLVVLLTPSLFLGSSFLVLVVSIHQLASLDRKVWSHAAVAAAVDEQVAASFTSAIDRSLRALGVPLTFHCDPRCCLLDLTEVAGRQLNRRSTDVLFQPLDLPRARDRNDPRLLRQ
jgi:hypothetical protein